MNNIKKEKNIFLKSINKDYKLIPLSARGNFLGRIRYLPAESKEWKNKIYFFNENILRNLPAYDNQINFLIKSYFNLFFNNFILLKKLTSYKLKSLSLNKIFISKPEIQYTNKKIVLTIYVYNREAISLLENIKKLNNSFFNKIFKFFYNYKSSYYKTLFYKELAIIRRYKLKLNLNKYKFEDIFLYKLGKLISRFYNKNVEFNVVNLQSIALNSDILTEFLKDKLKKRKSNVMGVINYIFTGINLSKGNFVREKGKSTKSIDFSLLENKYKNFNLNSIFNSNNTLDNVFIELYKNIFYNDKYFSLYKNVLFNFIKNFFKENLIFNDIKYKNIRGIKLEVKGRLTKRYRADRAILKTKWKGGLKNIDSSFKGLSVINYRGHISSSLEQSTSISKRRVGSFAIKGWINGR